MTRRSRFAALVLLLVAAGALAGCGGEKYPSDLADDAYSLRSMLLTADDIPFAMQEVVVDEFDNEEWAAGFETEDPVAKRRQFEAQGRIRNALAVFAWESPIEHLGSPRIITTQSTLYEDVDAARASLQGICGLPFDDATIADLREFPVKGVGDESVGLFLVNRAEIGAIIDTIVCFRTGRVVHAVTQNGLEGTEDVALAVRLARRMLERVDRAFAEL
ncbi:MAG: hypothetical protein Kow0010_04350 [Dehalococcoidia bacterium]